MRSILALVPLAVGCASLRSQPAPDAPDVVIIVLDTLRADMMSAYGNPLPTTPAVDKLAAGATRYNTAWAPSSWTLPSTTSIHTGLHPLRHGVRTFGDKLPSGQLTLAERLYDAGWRTGAWSDNANFGTKNALNQGFEQFASVTTAATAYPHAELMLRAAGDWLDDGGRPALTVVQPMNCHGPYRVPRKARTRLLGRKPVSGFKYYRGAMGEIMRRHNLSARWKVNDKYVQSAREQQMTAVRYATDEVGKMLAKLQASGRYDNALIIVTADHGEELFDHGGFSHGYTLHREVVQVPLIIKFPGQTEGRVVDGPASLMDIVPTVLAAVGLPATTAEGGPLDGINLGDASLGDRLPDRPLVFDLDWSKRTVARGLLMGDTHLIHIQQSYDGKEDVRELYDVKLDPKEKQDLAKADPVRLAQAAATLDQLWATLRAGTPVVENVLSEMDAEKLKLLGYME